MPERSVRLPDVGEGVAEAELAEWHVAVGDVVREDQVLAAVTTDKVTVEIPSPVGGTVVALGAAAGATLAVGAELVRIAVEGAAPAPPPGTPGAAPPPPAAPVVAAPALAARPMASPAVRRRAAEAGLDLRALEGSGPGGRIRQLDLDRALLHAGEPGGAQGRAGGRDASAAPPVTSPSVAPTGGVQEIRLTGVRRAIAVRMEATRRIAHFSYVEEVDVTELEALRAALRAAPGAGARPRLTVLPFVVLALVRAVADFPQMNALFDDAASVVRRHAAVHVGVATQTPTGLTVPVLRDAQALDLWACAWGIARISAAAREGVASRADLSGSTITVTSLGALGGIATTPVINPPEVAIVGVNRVATRPAWRDGGVVPRQMMNLSSSFDHRVIDGVEAAEFVQRIRALLEAPALLFMPP